jgi:hypothetical protein
VIVVDASVLATRWPTMESMAISSGIACAVSGSSHPSLSTSRFSRPFDVPPAEAGWTNGDPVRPWKIWQRSR